MLTVFFGTDHIRARKKAFDTVHACRAQGADVIELTKDAFSRAALLDAAGGMTLFGSSRVIVLDGVKEIGTDAFALLLEEAPALTASATHFILIEESLLAAEKKVLEKSSALLEEFTAKADERFNTFALADALARKDKKSLWLLFLRALRAGVSVEEIIGVLLWQVKTIRLAERTRSAAEAGMKDFSYRKAKTALTYFKPGEADALSRTLIALYHDGHRGLVDIDISLEKLILTL